MKCERYTTQKRQKLLERCSNSARNWIGKTITEETVAELAHAFYVEACTEWEVRQQHLQKLYQTKGTLKRTADNLKRRQERLDARRSAAADERSDLIEQMAATIGAMKDMMRRLRR